MPEKGSHCVSRCDISLPSNSDIRETLISLISGDPISLYPDIDSDIRGDFQPYYVGVSPILVLLRYWNFPDIGKPLISGLQKQSRYREQYRDMMISGIGYLVSGFDKNPDGRWRQGSLWHESKHSSGILTTCLKLVFPKLS